MASRPLASPSDIDDKYDTSRKETSSIQHVSGLDQVGDVKQVIETGNADFAAATAAGYPKPSPRLLFACFIAFLCSCANGYDGSLMTGINAMTRYQAFFGSGTTGSRASLIFAMYTVGQMVAAFGAGPLTDRFGRRVGMFVGGAFIILGASLAAGSHNMSMLIGARFVLGFGVCILTTAAPSYAVEIAPPQYRGRMTGFYNCGWFGGSVPAAFVTFGCQYMSNSNWSWRLPLLLQCVPSGIIMACVFFLPESPRWLMIRGRNEEAKAFLIKYHGNGDESNPIVALQLKEFHESIVTNGSDKRFWDYSGLFRNSNARWRALMMIFMGVFGQFSGNGLGYFNTVIYDNLGYTSVTAQLGLNIGSSCISACGAIIAVFLTDKMRRRPVLVWGTFACACLLAMNGGLSTAFGNSLKEDGSVNTGLGQASLAFYYLFNWTISFTYTPLQALYPVECLETTTRAKGMAMYAFVVNAISFINLYAGPIALKNIKNNYIYVFMGWDVVEAILWYVFAVETQGRTLEELEEIFSSPNPVAASKKRAKVAIKTSGQVAVVDDA